MRQCWVLALLQLPRTVFGELTGTAPPTPATAVEPQICHGRTLITALSRMDSSGAGLASHGADQLEGAFAAHIWSGLGEASSARCFPAYVGMVRTAEPLDTATASWAPAANAGT